jgi:hypothetical protein
MSISNIAFPKELGRESSYQIPSDVQSYTVKVVPSNVQSVASTVQTLTTAAYNQLLGNSQNINFDIPAGQSKSVFVDPRFSTLNFRVKYSLVAAGSTTTFTDLNLRSNAMSFFDREFVESQSGLLLSDVNNFGLVADTELQLGVDVAQRDAYALMYGLRFEDASSNSVNSNQGHQIAGLDNTTLTSAADVYYSYSVPLLDSLIGTGASKMFQIGATNRLRLTLVTAANLPLTIRTGVVTGAATFQVTMDNISLNLQYIDVGQEGLRMLGKTGGVQYYNGITHRVSSTTVPASTSGSISLLTGLKGSSVRSVISRFSENNTTATTGCVNGIYDSKMPLATSINYNINGLRIPSNPTDLVHNPAYAFSCLQQANANFKNGEFRSGIIPSQYCIYIAGGALATDIDKNVSAAGSSSGPDSLASFMFGENLEKIAKEGILSGMNLNAGQTFLEMNVANGNTNAYTAYFIAKQDIIYIHDLDSGEISVRL